MRPIAQSILGRFTSRLRFPQLFTVTAILFLLDLVIPDLIPFTDEILLGLLTALLGSIKRGGDEREAGTGENDDDDRPIKDVTPP